MVPRHGLHRSDVLLQEALELLGGSQQEVKQLQAERIHIHRELQRCLVEIQQRDQYSQQLNHKVLSQKDAHSDGRRDS